MKKILFVLITFVSCISLYAQSDSALIADYKRNIIQLEKLKSELDAEKQTLLTLKDDHSKQVKDLQATQNNLKEQMESLRGDLSSEKKKVADLNKNKVKIERDILLLKVDSLKRRIDKLTLDVSEAENRLISEKSSSKLEAEKAKQDGKNEVLNSISKLYLFKSFDELVISLNKQITLRDSKILINDTNVTSIINDLITYYVALNMIASKFDAEKIKSSQTSLSKINRDSKAIKQLNDDLAQYIDYNDYLKETIIKLIEFDSNKEAGTEASIQKLKFNDIMIYLSDFIYNYDDYTKYPYLSNVVDEIISRKKDNADKSITDLLQKL
jgi:hypothetical protein